MVKFRRISFHRFFLAVGLCLGFAVAALPQSQPQATLNGTVVDASGARVAGAQIVATRFGEQAAAAQTLTASDGSFTFLLAAGKYKISVAHEAFAPGQAQIELAAGQTRELRIAIELQPLSAGVVVTASAEPEVAVAASTPVSILTRADIGNEQSFSLLPLLATQSGVSFSRLGREGGVTDIFLDGGNSDFTKILVDGVPINEPGGYIDLSNYSLDSVDKIEIVHGAESSLFGSDAVAGVVQIFTHRGDAGGPTLNLESDGGTFSTAHGAADLSGGLGPFDYSAAAAYFDTAGQGINDGYLNRTVNGNFGYRISEGDTIRVVLLDIYSNAGAPGQTLYVPADPTAHDNLHNFVAGFAWNFNTGAHWQHRLSFGETSIHELYADPLEGFSTINQYNRADSEAQTSYLFRNGIITAGYENILENGFPGDIAPTHARRNNQAGYLDARWSPVPRLIFTAGFREEDNANFGTRGVPRVGVLAQLREGAGFFGATRAIFTYGQGIKEPAFYESFGADPCFPPNPNLNPEESQTYEAGLEQRFANDRIEVSADYFYNNFRDMITNTYDPTATSTCPFGTGTYFNTDLAIARGARLDASARPLRWLSFNANYTYDDSRVLVAPNAFDATETPGNHLLLRPVNSGNVIVNAAFRRMNWNLATRITGVRTDSDFLGLGYTRDPGYVLVNLAASYRVSRQIEFIGRIENLLNEFYQDALGYPGYHRAYSGGLRLTFSKE